MEGHSDAKSGMMASAGAKSPLKAKFEAWVIQK
jgi:hypothetical protein